MYARLTRDFFLPDKHPSYTLLYIKEHPKYRCYICTIPPVNMHSNRFTAEFRTFPMPQRCPFHPLAAFSARFVRLFRPHSGKLASLSEAQTVPSVGAGSTNLATKASQRWTERTPLWDKGKVPCGGGAVQTGHKQIAPYLQYAAKSFSVFSTPSLWLLS